MNHPQEISETIGKAAVFFHQGLLHFGYITEDREGKLSLLDCSGAALTLSPSRIVLISNHVQIRNPQELSSFKQKALELSNDFGRLQPQAESFESLCSRLEITQDEARFALFLHLKSHPQCYFQKHDKFFARNEVEIQAYLQAQQTVSERKEFLGRVQRYVQTLCSNDQSSGLSAEDAETLVTELRQLLQGNKKEDLEKLFSSYHRESTLLDLAIRMRRDLGDTANDPALETSGLPIAFINLQHDLEIKNSHLPLAGHSAFSIDDEDTLDYDDAISLQNTSDGYRVGIHVSNLALGIDALHPLFTEALERVSSLYLPAVNVPMLPTHFSQNVFSLCREAEKNVLSLYIDFDQNLQMRCSNLKLQRILIRENLSYSEVDRQRNNPDYEVLNRISTKLRDQRDTAQEKERFYYTLKAKDGKVTARKVDTQSPSRMMIEELMILYNRSIAQYAIGNNLPLLYRNINQFLDENQEVRNSSAFLSISPGYHPGIGAEAYLHATSPIRRVVDLINQMQVCSMLCEQQILFSKDALNHMIPNIEKRILQIRETVFRSERYWFLKYIEQEQMNKPLEAILKGYVNGKLKAAILPWGKQVLLDTDAKPEDDYFHFAVYAVDWDGQFLKADVIG